MGKLLLFVFLFSGLAAFSQATITGTVIDAESKTPLAGANVIETGTTNGSITDFDGNFTLETSKKSGTLTISYIGYTIKKVPFNGTATLGNVEIVVDADSLEEVLIVGSGVIDLAEDRKTPVAVSTITRQAIQDKVVGNVEITEVLEGTPSAYVSGQSGFGDSQLYLRGFDQTNIGVLLNGQPVNGMEDGRVYWSNWSGISDIANAIQVQRGLGASKLAISSVGGTTNILMKAAERNEGGFVRFLGANDSYFKATASYDSGMSESGWAFSVLLDHWQAHRKWKRGTYGEGQNYFFAVGYKPNETHSFNFLFTGAPQLHGQAWSQSKAVINADPKFNQHWGFYDGELTSERQNYYHKPVMNLNWDWNMGEKSDLSTVLYASWGRGGGTGPLGRGTIRTEDPDGVDGPLRGQIDYEAIEENNSQVGIGDPSVSGLESGYIRRSSVNNHQWYGMVSNFNHDFTDNLSFNIGVDGRMYTGDHFRQVTDFYGLSGWGNDRPDNVVVTSNFKATPWAALFKFADEGERINYDYSEDINYIGGFSQLEYSNDKFSAFVQGSYSSQSYQREDRFAALTSEKVDRTGYNIKGGVAYIVTEGNTIFFNAGYYSRQPYLDNIFSFNGTNADLISPEVDNEIIRSVEGGYHFAITDFKANFNAYVTDWSNRTISNIDRLSNGSEEIEVSVLQRGIRQYHTGAEFDFNWRTTSWFNINGYVSGGSWIYRGKSSVSTYNIDTQELISQEDGVNRQGVKVSTAPQFTTGLGARAKIISGLSIDGSINYRDRHYEFTDADTSVADYNPARLKPYSITDLGLTYKFNIGGSNDLTLRGNVFNVFDYIGLQNTDAFGYYIENGRTFNTSLKYSF